ncbi:uncharacterized protein A4U43_C05F3770 [Asparagus officinalis]|uniref:DUF4378 domain-containing protein n=1 Tax=Asparagus officinalis TaxID=4686 RepID=A0A5P1ERM9_ASPOF|nr:uncharacterized protein LOC109840435 [Asparagus officinalis]ONK67787.1 uncharacterized protein A4U43_C05F3770 [Asparagus officinalis]
MHRASREKRGSSSRSRSREKRAIVDPNIVAVERAQREGNVQLRKQTNLSKIALDFAPGSRVPIDEENLFDPEIRHDSFKKDSKTTTTRLINKQLSKEMENRWSPANVVARLMGLDVLPPVFTRQHKEKGSSIQTAPSVGFREKHRVYEAYPLQMSSDEHPECIDVFEVNEMSKVEKQNTRPPWKKISSLGRSEVDLRLSDIDLAYAKRFINAAHLSVDDESNDASDELETNESRFVRNRQEPNSLFRKLLQDQKRSPPPHPSQITILKPSRVGKSDKYLSYRPEPTTERFSRLLKRDVSSCRKPVPDLFSHSLKEHSSSLSYKSSEPLNEGKTKNQFQIPIVILKPTLEKAWETMKTVPSARSPDNYPFSLRRRKRIPLSRSFDIYGVGRARHRLSDSVEVMGQREKHCREIARDITRRLKSAGSTGRKVVEDQEKCGYSRHESSCHMSGMENLTHKSIFDQVNECVDSLGASSSYSVKSSISNEATKRLSDRWKLIRKIQEVRSVHKGYGTLEEMLVSDREMPRFIQNVSGEEVTRNEIYARRDFPVCTSGKDGWRKGSSSNSSSSKSLPNSPYLRRNHTPSKRERVGISDRIYLQNFPNKSPSVSLARNMSQRRPSVQNIDYLHNACTFCREENEMFEREIHMNSERLCDKIHSTHPSEEARLFPKLSNSSIAGSSCESSSLVSQHKDANFPVSVDDEHVQNSTVKEAQENEEFSGAGSDYVAEEETSVAHVQGSPVPVIEQPQSEEDKSSSECFEKINADLKELQIQLKLHKSESTSTNPEDLELLISTDNDIEEECYSPPISGEILEAFIDDDDRDFSYLLDVLISSGIHSTSTNELFNKCTIQESPAGSDLFEKLEKKYGVLVSWPKPERKLLFDLVSYILADIIAPSIDLCSKKSRSRANLVEDVWQLVVEQKELSGTLEEEFFLDPMWLKLEEDVNMIGKKLESWLLDKLMEELLSELI